MITLPQILFAVISASIIGLFVAWLSGLGDKFQAKIFISTWLTWAVAFLIVILVVIDLSNAESEQCHSNKTLTKHEAETCNNLLQREINESIQTHERQDKICTKNSTGFWECP